MSQYVKNSGDAQKRGRGFQKGNKLSHGRPKTAKCIPDLLRAIGDEKVPATVLAKVQASWGPDFKPTNMRDALLRTTYADAINGDSIARQFIAERCEGKVSDKLILDDQTPCEVIFREIRSGDGTQVESTTIKRTINRQVGNGNPS